MMEGEQAIPSQVNNLLTRSQQSMLLSIATSVRYPKSNRTIFTEGEKADFVYCVGSGVVRVGRHAEGGRRQILAFMMPGDLFGLPDSGNYLNWAETVSPSILYRIPWRALREILLAEPEFQLNLLVRVAFDLRQAQSRILILGQQNVLQRLSSFLLDFINHPDFYDTRRRVLAFPISRFDLGDYLGSSSETITRAFSKLEELGLIRRLTPKLIEVEADALRSVLTGRRRAFSSGEVDEFN